MSCNISVDLDDSSGNYQTSSGPSDRFSSTATSILNHDYLLTLLRRALHLRRLKLLKFYMAIIVVFLIVFILLKPDATVPDQVIKNFEAPTFRSADVSDGTDGGYLIGQKHSSKETTSNELSFAAQDAHISLASKRKSMLAINRANIGNGKHSAVIAGHPTFPSNLTYSLTTRDFNQMKSISLMEVRIREAMKHSWDNYRRYAWGYDMLKPRSKEPDHWFNLGLTIVDAADTLIMMGLAHDANLALDWIENELNFTSSNNENSNCFEMTIRILAGILSAYHLTERDKLKQQAVEFGNILLHCYDTESRVIPYSDIDLSTHRAHPPQWNPHSSLSEVASLQLEFRYLSQITGNPIYEQTTFQTSEHLHNLTRERRQKLLPMYINPSNGQLEDSMITLGARADSYYEYLLKQYLQTGIKWLEDDYLDCVDEIGSRLLRHTNGVENYTYVAEMQIYKTINDTEDVKYFNKMDHLVCFLPGTLVLGYYHFSPLAADYRLKFNLETPDIKLNSRYDDHLRMAQALARTCYHMYSNMGTGLAPEIAQFVHVQPDDSGGGGSSSGSQAGTQQPELQVPSSSAHNILRPEFVESLFYLYHITNLRMYREQAGQVFEAFQKYSRISSGFSPVSDVRKKPESSNNLDELLHRNAPDRMESFWLSETLKYLYLTFCDDRHVVGTLLNNYVFNTEAHVLPIL